MLNDYLDKVQSPKGNHILMHTSHPHHQSYSKNRKLYMVHYDLNSVFMNLITKTLMKKLLQTIPQHESKL